MNENMRFSRQCCTMKKAPHLTAYQTVFFETWDLQSLLVRPKCVTDRVEYERKVRFTMEGLQIFFWSNRSWWILWRQKFTNFNVQRIQNVTRKSLLTYSFYSFSSYRNRSGLKRPRPLSRENSFFGKFSFFKHSWFLSLIWNISGQCSLEFNKQKVALKNRLHFAGPLSV